MSRLLIEGWVPLRHTRWSVGGRFVGDSLYARVTDPSRSAVVQVYRLAGLRTAGSFTVTVHDTTAFGARRLGELTATQQ